MAGIESGLDYKNYSLNFGNISNSSVPEIANSYAGTMGGGTAVQGAGAGGGGSMVGLGAMLLAQIGGSIVGGIFDAWQGDLNRKQQQRMFDTQMGMAERQFGWGQKVDRFNMNMANRQQGEAEKVNKFNMTQKQADEVNELLRTNAALREDVRSRLMGRGSFLAGGSSTLIAGGQTA